MTFAGFVGRRRLRGHHVAGQRPPGWHVLELPFLSALMDYQELTLDPLGWLKALWVPWTSSGCRSLPA